MVQSLVILPALVGVALGFYAWFMAGTGVTGTPGALLALVGAVAVWLGAVLLVLPSVRSWVRGVLVVLVALGSVLTATAAWFLMQNAFAIAMAATFAFVVVALAAGGPARNKGAYQ